MAQAIAPDARVVYVDNDPVACSHGQALLGPRDKVGFVLGDLRRPDQILRHPDVLARIDFSRPVGVLCACALHFVPDQEEPHQVIAGYRDHLAPGSYLAITHGIAAAAPEDDPDGLVERVTDVYRNASAQIHVRPVKDIERFFDGLEVLEPGVVWMARWAARPRDPASPAEFPVRRRRTQTRRLTADCGAEPHSTAGRPVAPAATACQPPARAPGSGAGCECCPPTSATLASFAEADRERLAPARLNPDVLGDHARMVIRATRPSSISNAKCDEPFEVPLEVSTVSTIVWPMRSTRVRSIRTSGPLNSHSPQARISSWPATWRPQSSITASGVNAPTKLSVSCALAAAMSLSTTLGSDSVSGTSLPF